MKPHYVILAALATTSLLALAAAPEKLPAAWMAGGTAAPEKISAGIDQSDVGGVRGAKYLRNASDDTRAFASLTQQISAQNYLGQRIRFRARVRAQDVSGWAGLWMRVDTPTKHSAAFYNSGDKPIKGSSDWQERSVVLDVPADASVISFGVLDAGKGTVWIDALGLETVGRDVPVDGMPARKALPTVPTL